MERIPSARSHLLNERCDELCPYNLQGGLWKASGPSNFSRNLVYLRDERVEGSKTSDNTLSTIAYVLNSIQNLTYLQQKLYRTDFDKDEKFV